MNENEKKLIKKIITEHTDDLEDELNFSLRTILKNIGIEKDTDLEAITYAREIFFGGKK
jgi:hypothetical protein